MRAEKAFRVYDFGFDLIARRPLQYGSAPAGATAVRAITESEL
jgi:hypothetical protein